MIDGRGQVLIMDFGLAAIADQVEGAEVRNGTPAYMAPEQLAGREVTERSDIYSLGLVLYEMFTGKRAFETRDRSDVPSAASVIKDVDPAVERLIAKCLDSDAAKRPQTALAVARALPGGDPLAEALAAGDTPSPEMVAASEDTGALSVRAATEAVCEAHFGNMAAAKGRAEAALQLAKGRDVEYAAAFALALAGDSSGSQNLAGDLEKRFPEDTPVQFEYLPTLRALFALAHQAPLDAVERLQTALPYDFVPAPSERPKKPALGNLAFGSY